MGTLFRTAIATIALSLAAAAGGCGGGGPNGYLIAPLAGSSVAMPAMVIAAE